MRKSHEELKRFFDVYLSLIGLFLVLPLWGIIAILIKLDSPGPVFFTQLRIGRWGKPFKMYKFRTMYKNVPFIAGEGGAAVTKENDPRITKIGKYLRKFSIDETPQFINVILGEMSIVGPRPELSIHLKNYNSKEIIRLSMKPGLTGLSQIMGRNLLTWENRKKYDIIYVENWSLKLDFKIILATIPVVIKGVGAFNND